MTFPRPASGIVDATCQISLGVERQAVPKHAVRDDFSLQHWPSKNIVGYLFPGGLDQSEAAEMRRAEIERVNADIDLWLDLLTDNGISLAGCDVALDDDDEIYERIQARADRVYACVRVNPHDGMQGIRRLAALRARFDCIRAVAICPFAIYPFIHVNSKEYYPIFAKCVELDLPVYIHAGFPGPRVPAWVQDPMHIDEVCWFFPDLTIIMRHGGEPWADVCVKMMLRWPNLYYATSAVTPRFYPGEIVTYLRTRGADKIIFAGYWPTLSYEKTWAELAEIELKPETWEKFLSSNARKVFRLPGASPT